MSKKQKPKGKEKEKVKKKRIGYFGWLKRHDPDKLAMLSREAAKTQENIERRHKWTSEEAAEAARKGALERWKKLKK